MLSRLLRLGERWTLVGGKGGVGKTTTAAALAVSLADAGEPVLALSTDPAHSLGDALGVRLGPDPEPVPGVPGLHALEIDAERERTRFLSTHRGRLLQLIERGTYLDPDDAAGIVDLAVPGVDELAALFRLMEMAEDPELHLVVDTAPTGHTLRLLDIPTLARGWLAALKAMEEKHEAVSLALAGAYRPNEAAQLLETLDGDLARLSALLRDPGRTRFALVTTPEPVVLAETRRYQAALAERGIGLAGIVVNRSRAAVDPSATGGGMAFVPALDPEPRGVEGLRRFAASAHPTPAPSPPATPAGEGERIAVDGPFTPPADRRLYLVGGKGGVGKSTAAGALAVWLSRRRAGPVLLLSTDPAGSLADVLAQEVDGTARPVEGAPGLVARQLDAAAAWAEFRDQFREQVERLFSGLLGGGLSAAADRRVVERLVDLAPPGVDELMALMEVVDATEDRPYDALVLDTAPTGHLLRLLEMPRVALEWTHALLRLLLKYREAIGLGDLAERVLRLSRELRAVQARLTDPAQSWMLLVALPEALSVPETERLVPRLREMGIEPGALLVNRLLAGEEVRPEARGSARRLLEIGPGIRAAAAPAMERGPRGAEDLSLFLGSWRQISP